MVRIGNTDDRLGRLENMLADLESFGGRSSGGFLRPDRSMMVKLTKTQTSLIKLHTDVNDLLLKVEEAPILGEDHLDTSNPSLPYRQLVKFMNLGRGTQVDGAYQPVSAESMSKDMMLPPLGQNFRERALACLRIVSSEVESLGSRLSVIAVGDSVAMNHQNIAGKKSEQRGSLWDHYIQDCRKRMAERKLVKPHLIASSNKFNSANGGKMGRDLTVNDLSSDLKQLVDEGVLNLEQAIAMLKEHDAKSHVQHGKIEGNNGDRSDDTTSSNEDTWKLTGAAGKKKKKQRKRELEEQRRRERESNARRTAEIEAQREMHRRQQLKQHQKNLRSKQRAQQEAMRRAQEQQQLQLQRQMKMMQMQLQKQIEMQKAAAAQIQKQIEEQQRQAMLEQRSNSNPAMQFHNVQRFSQKVNSQRPGHMQVKQPSQMQPDSRNSLLQVHRTQEIFAVMISIRATFQTSSRILMETTI